MEDRVISSAVRHDDSGQEHESVVEQDQNQNTYNAAFILGGDRDGSRQGFECPGKGEDKQGEGEEEGDGQEDKWINEVRRQTDNKDCDKGNGPDQNTHHHRDLDGPFEAVPQWPGDDQIPVAQREAQRYCEFMI